MNEETIKFGTLEEQGGKLVETNIRLIKHTDIRKCEHYILIPEHYRPDGSCRCNDPNHSEMKEWGYDWIGGCWR